MTAPRLRELPRGAIVQVIAVVVGAVVLTALTWLIGRPSSKLVIPLLYLTAATQLTALLPVRGRDGTTHTLASLPLAAAGLLSPGAAVALIAWTATFDGRLPGPDIRIWQLLWNRASAALEHGVISLGVALIPDVGPLTIALKTLAYALCYTLVNYALMARLIAYIRHTNFLGELTANLTIQSGQGTLVMGFGGGILFVLVNQQTVGMVMGVGLLGFLLAVRGNMAFAIEQANIRIQTLRLAAQTLDARDRYTEMHSVRVAELASGLGELLGLPARMVEDLSTAGALHDIGKIGIRDHILNKAGPLTPDEWEAMRAHAALGAEMIAEHSALAHLAPMVRHHHERWNGTGYPDGIRGETIPLGARILAVADSFDTITGPRVYRTSSMNSYDAVQDISSKAGIWYDHRVVDALREMNGLPPLVTPQEPMEPAIGAIELIRSNRPFAWLLAAVFVSAIGDPLTTVATLVSIYAITRQPLLVAATYMVKAVATIVAGATLGNLADRLPRRPLILWLELGRGLLLVFTPVILLKLGLGWIFPILFVLASIELVVQPARQSLLPRLVPENQLASASAVTLGAIQAASILGFPLAGALLLLVRSTWPLFVIDGLTFAGAGLLVLLLGSIGSGSRIPFSRFGAVGRAWKQPQVRPHLVNAAVAAFFIAMSLPNLITLAYRQSPSPLAAQAYTLLEAVLGLGFVVGSLLVTYMRRGGARELERSGLAVMGFFSVALLFSPALWASSLLIYLATLGNPIYAAGNQAALLAAGNDRTRGAIMSTRLMLAQAAALVGALAGGLIGSKLGPQVAFGILGAGLILLYLALQARAEMEAGIDASETALMDRPRPQREIPPVVSTALGGPDRRAERP